MTTEAKLMIGDMVLFKVRHDGKSKIGRIKDIQNFSAGVRYAIERRVTGRFLDDIPGYIDGCAHFIKDTRWCFFMWMKPERIIRTIKP